MNSAAAPVAFDRFDLAPAVLRAVSELGYEAATPIQAGCIPPLLEGRDLLGQAQTGTGKTAAFALPLLSRIDLGRSVPQLLVLAPTRELALQVAEAFQRYARHLSGFHVLPLYGGQDYRVQLRQLQRGVQVVIGTPGRVMDHIRRGTLKLDGIRTLVLDEADEMLNMGFAEDIEWIFEQAPPERQVALFSATMPPAIRKVAATHLTDPVELRITRRAATVDTIEQHHCIVTRHHKLDLLTRLLELEPVEGMIVFVRTKLAAAELAEKLVAHGLAADALHGDMGQAAREQAVEKLKQGRLDILVATDVAARGLDVERITHVVNFDIPNDPESYVHRIGRTGRAGRRGKALLFVQPRERHLLRAIEKAVGQGIPPLEPPSADQLTEHRIQRFTELLNKTLDEQDLDFFHRLVGRIAKEQGLEPMQMAAALTYLYQRKRPLQVAEPARKRQSPPTEGGDGAGRGRGERTESAPPAHPGDRQEKRARERRPEQRRSAGEESVPMVRYRIEVGSRDGVTPREIVGAIANEAGLEGRYIGRIEIEEDHSCVDLPDGMPREIAHHLRRVMVCGRPLMLRQLGPAGQPDSPPKARKRPTGAKSAKPKGRNRAG